MRQEKIIIRKRLPAAFSLALVLFVLLALPGWGAKKTTADEILADMEWAKIYNLFPVDESLAEGIAAKVGDDLSIEVYLATWCSDSRDHVPPFLKIVTVLDNIRKEKLNVNYYTVDRKPNKKTKYYVKDLKVERVPTFIFYRNGKEIGRIIETPKNTLLEDVMEIVF